MLLGFLTAKRNHDIDLINASREAVWLKGRERVKDLQAADKESFSLAKTPRMCLAIAQANVGAQIGPASDITRAVAEFALLEWPDGIMPLLNISERAFGWESLCSNYFCVTRGHMLSLSTEILHCAELLLAASLDQRAL